jgi:drug/metabolite transporter (DMT)-like permease
MPRLKALPQYIWNQGWLVLLFTAIIWGCNAIAAKMATSHISPMSLVFLRWLFVCTLLGAFIWKDIRQDFVELLVSWKRLVWMGFAGFTGFSALFYLAAYKTTAVNITILQSSMPPLVLLGALIFFNEQVTGWRVLGMLMGLASIVVIATRGHIESIALLSFNLGDIAILLACVLYAAYTLSLRNRPAVKSIVFFFGMSIAALVTSIPLAVSEVALGHWYIPTLQGFGVLIFVTLGPSLTAQLAYMRGVQLIGPARASLFPSLVPAFGALFAVMFLGESFAAYHAAALALGAGGIYFSEVRGKLSAVKPLQSQRT